MKTKEMLLSHFRKRVLERFGIKWTEEQCQEWVEKMRTKWREKNYRIAGVGRVEFAHNLRGEDRAVIVWDTELDCPVTVKWLKYRI